MKELTVKSNDAGQRLDRFVGKAVPLLPDSLLQTARCPFRLVQSMDMETMLEVHITGRCYTARQRMMRVW